MYIAYIPVHIDSVSPRSTFYLFNNCALFGHFFLWPPQRCAVLPSAALSRASDKRQPCAMSAYAHRKICCQIFVSLLWRFINLCEQLWSLHMENRTHHHMINGMEVIICVFYVYKCKETQTYYSGGPVAGWIILYYKRNIRVIIGILFTYGKPIFFYGRWTLGNCVFCLYVRTS